MADDAPIVVDPNLYLRTYTDDWQSETTSIQSSIYKGIIENGRRYQTLKNEYCYPSDEQQFETYEATHLAAVVADSSRPNPLFQSPVGPSPKNILDIGTGKGSWAIDVADMFPNTTVRGVDLFPPPVTWMPPNCILEVDDILQEWTWHERFDLIHLRVIQCAFTPKETEQLMKQCYENLEPGGWIEHLELHPNLYCDDDSIPHDNVLFSVGPTWDVAGDKSGRPMNIITTMRASIEKAGFIDVHERNAKWPLGPWARDQTMKELGLVNLQHWLSGLEGYAMHLFTKYGDPVPWTKEEVQVYIAQIRKELLNPRHHAYQRARRVWARKPLLNEKVEKIENDEKGTGRRDSRCQGAHQSDGQVNRAVELLEHIVNVEGALLDTDNPDRLASVHELARAYQADGQNKRAVQLLEYVVAVEKNILGEEDPARLASQHMFARAY